MRKQPSLSLRLKQIFLSEDIKEKYFALLYRTDFKFNNHMLMIEIDKKGHVDRDPDYERKRRKELQNCGYYLIGIDLDEKDFNGYEEFGRVSAYIAESFKKQTEK